MIRTMLTIAAGILIASAVTAAPPCRDAKGHFAKCPPAGATVTSTTTTATATNVTKDKAGRCHIASGAGKGRFTKCPA